MLMPYVIDSNPPHGFIPLHFEDKCLNLAITSQNNPVPRCRDRKLTGGLFDPDADIEPDKAIQSMNYLLTFIDQR
jgi:hypothetical protein